MYSTVPLPISWRFQGAAVLHECLPPRRLVHVSPADALVLLSEAFPWLEKLSPLAVQQYKAMGMLFLMFSTHTRTA